MSYDAQKIAERRQAVDMLKKQEKRYRKSYKHTAADAMDRAARDVWRTLREHAQELIEESTSMRWVHESWPLARTAA